MHSLPVPSPPVPTTQHAPLSPADAWRHAKESKASADVLYASNAEAALRHYQEAASTLDAICMASDCGVGANADDGRQARAMLGICQLNAALCCSKMQRFDETEKMASIALGQTMHASAESEVGGALDELGQCKALYTRAKARLALREGQSDSAANDRGGAALLLSAIDDLTRAQRLVTQTVSSADDSSTSSEDSSKRGRMRRAVSKLLRDSKQILRQREQARNEAARRSFARTLGWGEGGEPSSVAHAKGDHSDSGGNRRFCSAEVEGAVCDSGASRTQKTYKCATAGKGGPDSSRLSAPQGNTGTTDANDYSRFNNIGDGDSDSDNDAGSSDRGSGEVTRAEQRKMGDLQARARDLEQRAVAAVAADKLHDAQQAMQKLASVDTAEQDVRRKRLADARRALTAAIQAGLGESDDAIQEVRAAMTALQTRLDSGCTR